MKELGVIEGVVLVPSADMMLSLQGASEDVFPRGTQGTAGNGGLGVLLLSGSSPNMGVRSH